MIYRTDAYSTFQTSKMERFTKMVNDSELFSRKASSYMFERALNKRLLSKN